MSPYIASGLKWNQGSPKVQRKLNYGFFVDQKFSRELIWGEAREIFDPENVPTLLMMNGQIP